MTEEQIQTVKCIFFFPLMRVQLSAERVLGLQTLNPDMEQCVSANESESFTLAAAPSLSLLRRGCAGLGRKRRQALNV